MHSYLPDLTNAFYYWLYKKKHIKLEIIIKSETRFIIELKKYGITSITNLIDILFITTNNTWIKIRLQNITYMII